MFLSHFPMPGKVRWLFVKYAGVKFSSGSKTTVFIGENVIFDMLYPDEIEIGNHVHNNNRMCIINTLFRYL